MLVRLILFWQLFVVFSCNKLKRKDKLFLAYPTAISVNPNGARKWRLTWGCKTTLVHDVSMTIFAFFDVLIFTSVSAKVLTATYKRGAVPNFSSSKNVVILAYSWQNNTYSSLNATVEGRVCKKKIHNGYVVQIKNSVTRVTVRHNSASLVMPKSYPRDGIFNQHLTTIKDSYFPPVYQWNKITQVGFFL